jgi:hypothetical protein
MSLSAIFEPLIGLELWSPARSVDLVSFQIGGKHKSVEEMRNEDTRGEFALHLQCVFRIRRLEKILTSEENFYHAAKEDDDDFDWRKPRTTLFDKRAAGIFQPEKRRFFISSFEIGAVGSFSLACTNDLFLDVFPCGFGNQEHWRLFEFDGDKVHHVFRGSGLLP